MVKEFNATSRFRVEVNTRPKMSRNDLDSTERARFEAFRGLVVKIEVKTHDHVHWDRLDDQEGVGTADGAEIIRDLHICLALVVRHRVGAEQGRGPPGPAWTRISSTRKFNAQVQLAESEW